MSLVAAIRGKGPSGFGYGSTADEVTGGLDLSGKTIVLTGCNSGIGFETLRTLGKRGARVLALARSRKRAQEACDRVALADNSEGSGSSGPGELVPMACDLDDPASVRICVAEIRKLGTPLDAVICNAGIMALPQLEQRFGVERQLFVNHFAHFLLVTGLLDQLSEDGRVVMVSSGAHNAAPREGMQFDNLSGEHGYSPWQAYGQSKLANLLFARELSRRFEGSRRTANAIHPGVINTHLSRHMNPVMRLALSAAEPLFLKSPQQGAATQVYVATHPGAADLSGQYFSHCNVVQSSQKGRDLDLARKLWEKTEAIVKTLPG